jgi:hypothetical protein
MLLTDLSNNFFPNEILTNFGQHECQNQYYQGISHSDLDSLVLDFCSNPNNWWNISLCKLAKEYRYRSNWNFGSKRHNLQQTFSTSSFTVPILPNLMSI